MDKFKPGERVEFSHLKGIVLAGPFIIMKEESSGDRYVVEFDKKEPTIYPAVPYLKESKVRVVRGVWLKSLDCTPFSTITVDGVEYVRKYG